MRMRVDQGEDRRTVSRMRSILRRIPGDAALQPVRPHMVQEDLQGSQEVSSVSVGPLEPPEGPQADVLPLRSCLAQPFRASGPLSVLSIDEVGRTDIPPPVQEVRIQVDHP